ncbi:MAG: PEP-CTERM sorting domain-containing protein [Candidatus Korobacteraceae bacterium]
MNLRIASLSLLTLCLILADVPAAAQGIYNNGPINGNTDAWTINFGYIVSDTFTISGGTTTVTGVTFGAWLYPGDTLTSVEVDITSGENGGTTYFDQVVPFTGSGCMVNQYGYNVCAETGLFNGPTLNNGTYWLNLENASVPSGDPVYWDENSGIGCTSPGCPSEPSENSVGSIPSESFTMLGTTGSSTSTSTTTTGTVPEPGSIMLFGSGILGLVGVLRRKLL